MLENKLNKLTPESQTSLGSVFLVINAFVWYFLAANTLQTLIDQNVSTPVESQLIWASHFLTLTVSLIAGTFLVRRGRRNSLFLLWVLLGIISPLTLLALSIAVIPILYVAAILFGLSIGLGMPNCMEHFKQSTANGNRGRYAGLIILVTGLSLFLLRQIGEGVILTVLLLSIWRLLGLVVILIIKPFRSIKQETKAISYSSILRQRSFILYIVPWIMFSVVNYLSLPIQFRILDESTVVSLQIIENAIGGMSAIAAGFLMDYIGRKQAAIGGFAMLGVSYAILGIYPAELASWYLYTVLDGIAWGTLTILFVVTIWGELNEHSPSDKYYALGVFPFFVSKFIQLFLVNSSSNFKVLIMPSMIFPFTAFFLFLAVLPLFYAPETLSEKLVKERDLNSYIEKAQRIASK